VRGAIPLLALLVGCAGHNYVEVGIGPQIGGQWEGTGGVVDVAVGREGDKTFCEYRHTSNLTSGPPFNDRFENTVDRISCGLRMGGK
jgi:hypothetical protein